MKKYKDLESSEQNELDSTLDIAVDVRKLNFEGRYHYRYQQFGLCADCVSFDFVETEFKIIYARCNDMKIKLSSAYPIKNCTNYRKCGQMDIWDMKNIAILIDPNKNEIGF